MASGLRRGARRGVAAGVEPLISAVGRELAREYALTGGDDYELLFTVPLARLGAMNNAWHSGWGQ
jgi:thiamine monophosphate kinase